MSEQLEQAADWLDQLESLDAEQQKAFTLWFSQHDNQRAFARIANAMGSAELLAVADSFSEHTKASDNFVPANDKVHSLDAEKSVKKEHKPKRLLMGLSVAAAVACFTTLVFLMTPTEPVSSSESLVVVNEPIAEFTPQILATSVAEQRSKVLQDGSVVFLNGSSELDVRHSDATRQVVLNKGQVYFDIAKDSSRPFVINIDDATVRVVGTAFDIDRLAGLTTIRVYEGVVDLVSASRATLRLVRGQSAQLIDGQWSLASAINDEQLPSWRSGWLSVEDQALSIVIEKLSRFLTKPVVIKADGDMPITGRFSLLSAVESLGLLSTSANMRLVEFQDRYELVPAAN